MTLRCPTIVIDHVDDKIVKEVLYEKEYYYEEYYEDEEEESWAEFFLINQQIPPWDDR